MSPRALLRTFCLWIGALPIAVSASVSPELPNLFYEAPALTLETVVLGRTCMSLPANKNGLHCNPAMLAKETNKQLRLNVFLDDHVEDAIDYGREVRDDDTPSIINRLLAHPDPAGSRLTASAWYRHENLAVVLVPARLAFVSEVRNPAYPQINVHAVRESEFSLKGGWLIEDDERFQVGAQIRYLQREFIREDIALLDALANPDRARIRTQNSFSFEPAVVYTVANDAWKPSIAFMMTDLQVVVNGDDENSTSPVPEFGFSSRPSFAEGKLVTSTHFSFRRQTEFWKRLRWGAVFEAGFGDLSLSLAKGEVGVGLSSAIDSVTLGLAYKSEEVSTTTWKASTIQTFMAEAGLRF